MQRREQKGPFHAVHSARSRLIRLLEPVDRAFRLIEADVNDGHVIGGDEPLPRESLQLTQNGPGPVDLARQSVGLS